jgi:hypothetical protein
MILVSIQPFAPSKIALATAAILGLLLTACFADPLFVTAASTAGLRQSLDAKDVTISASGVSECVTAGYRAAAKPATGAVDHGSFDRWNNCAALLFAQQVDIAVLPTFSQLSFARNDNPTVPRGASPIFWL